MYKIKSSIVFTVEDFFLEANLAVIPILNFQMVFSKTKKELPLVVFLVKKKFISKFKDFPFHQG
jgi:hypothetical protein